MTSHNIGTLLFSYLYCVFTTLFFSLLFFDDVRRVPTQTNFLYDRKSIKKGTLFVISLLLETYSTRFFLISKSFLESHLHIIYSEKVTKFCEIFTLLLSYGVPVKSKMKILQDFVAFSEYMNFI